MDDLLDQVRRPGTVLIAVVLTYLGGGSMTVAGLLFLFGAGTDPLLGRVQLAGASVSVETAVVIGPVLAAVGATLVVLAVLVQRGSNRARIGLTVIGAVFGCLELYSIATGDVAASIPPLVWIATAVGLLWTGDGAWFRRRA